MRDQFIATLTEMAEADDSVVLITGDLGFGVLNDFAKRFPKQYINAGVAEQNMTGIASGMALEGYKVYTYSIANFVFMRCLEQIRNDAAYHDANVNVVSVGGGFSYGALGISHHATEDLAIMRTIPGATVFCPSDTWETDAVTRASAASKGVSYLRLDKSVASTPETSEPFAVGRARLIQEGSDVTFVAAGGILQEVLDAANQLRQHGVSAAVMSLPTIKPLDENALRAAARKTKAMVCVEEHTVLGGIGSAVAEVLLSGPDRPEHFLRIGLEDQFSSVVGSQAYLRAHYGLNCPAILDRTLKLLGRAARPAVAA
ncbi:transketolase family protein [Roseimaritima ulvae]|uniref:1-deoxy-D-xylulose-5-phosphate synthase n=1 Tax=Roseimaritima ulvae TaxID=980254 RepID=A0A5B9R8L4_9BACT|nr:transketolase C-terminal domain-containing protein [Roseimaritima ulvae]QEG42973.1 1-deoxy-D-xylulose-5-phosphate synthase [Roseimaritima ulvae]